MKEKLTPTHFSRELALPLEEMLPGDIIRLSQRGSIPDPKIKHSPSQMDLEYVGTAQLNERTAVVVQALSRVGAPAKTFPQTETFAIPVDEGCITTADEMRIYQETESGYEPTVAEGGWTFLSVSRVETKPSRPYFTKVSHALGQLALLVSRFKQ